MKVDSKRTRRIYEKLQKVAPELGEFREHAASKIPGLMDLTLDILERSKGYRRVALAHCWRHTSGDMIADPDMEIAVFLDDRLAEALTYQDAFRYDQSYPDPDDAPDLMVHTRLNVFLEQWLDNLAEQGHVVRVNYRISILGGERCDKL